MEKDKKSKKNSLEKLRNVLDTDNGKKLHPEDDKYLKALSKRLHKSSEKEIVYKEKIEKQYKEVDPLKPKVTIHTRKPIKPPVVEKTITEVPVVLPPSEIKEGEKSSIKDEEVFEIEKVEYTEPEFVEIKPKEVKKQEEQKPVSKVKEPIEDEKLTEWKPVEEFEKEIPKKEETTKEMPSWEKYDEGDNVIKDEETIDDKDLIDIEKTPEEVKPAPEEKEKPIKIEEKKEGIIVFCSNCGAQLKDGAHFCTYCGNKVEITIDKTKEEKQPLAFIPVKKIEKKDESPKWEPIDVEETKEEKVEIIPVKEDVAEDVFDEDKEMKINAFKDVESIDENTAILLYDSGYTSVDTLKIASVKDLSKVKGLKKKIAKNIKKELDEKEAMSFENSKNTLAEDTPLVIEDKIEELPDKKEEIKKEPSGVWEEPESEKEKVEKESIGVWEDLDENKEEKIKVFKDIESIDENTAILLYDNGYNSIDILKEADVKDISRIKGIKKKTAKNIKKELDLKEIKKNEKINNNITEEEVLDTPPEISQETAELKISEEQIETKEKDDILEKEVKIETFKEIQSISENTAILLYDNGITSVEELKKAELKEISKIKGIKKKTAKNIKEELEKQLKESVKVKPIVMGESAEIKISKDQITKEEETFDKEETPTPVELHTESEEWSPIEEEIEDEKIKEKEEISDLEIIEDKEEKRIKIETFKEIQSISENTAILLYDNGITSVEELKKAELKEISKIKGIKKKTAKNIKEELEPEKEKITKKKQIKKEKEEIVDEVEEGEPSEYFLEEEDLEEEKEVKQIDEKILVHKTEEPEEEFFDEKEEIEDIPPIKEEANDTFKDIISIDEKIAKLLQKNGIDSIEKLNNKKIKELTKIRGIKKKDAKQIKKEVKEILEKSDQDLYDRDNNPFIDESEEDEWELLTQEKIPEKVFAEINEYRHGDYTLYEKRINTKSGKKQLVRFFSKGKPDDAEPIGLPKGYEVKENKKTKVPYLKRKK